MKKKIMLTFGITFLLTLLIQFIFLDGFNQSDLKGFNINLMVSILTILATVFILDKIIQKHETKSKLNDYLNTLGLAHERFIFKLEGKFNHIVTKDINMAKIEDVMQELNNYINRDFVRNPIKTVSINPYSIFDYTEGTTDYFTYLTKFKNEYKNEITEYLNRYASVIPPEIMHHILKIDNALKLNILTSPADHGIVDPRINIYDLKFNPDDFIEAYKQIGEEILALKKYIKSEEKSA